MQTALLALQAFQVAFLWLHDWVPLGRLNDVAAVRRQDPPSRLVIVTLVQSVPFTLGLAWSWRHFGEPFSRWPLRWLWVSYGVLFAGQLRAWWLPYLLRPEEARATRYQQMFGRTHAFLPPRHGIVPNTAHVLLHLATLATLLGLLIVTCPAPVGKAGGGGVGMVRPPLPLGEVGLVVGRVGGHRGAQRVGTEAAHADPGRHVGRPIRNRRGTARTKMAESLHVARCSPKPCENNMHGHSQHGHASFHPLFYHLAPVGFFSPRHCCRWHDRLGGFRSRHRRLL